MKILVTGANGLLGQKLSALLMEDENVLPILTTKNKISFPIVRGISSPMDITDRQQVESVLRETTPDVVINTAAMTLVDKCETEQDECWKNNVEAVKNLIDGCKSIGAHLIHVSTDFIFKGDHGPLDENATPEPVNFYGKSKAAAEELIQKSDINWSILRTVLVYGVTFDMSRTNIVLWVKDSLEKGKSIKVVNDQWRTPTLAEDLAMGCYLAAKKKASGIYNISGKDFMTPYDMAIKTADVFGLDKSLITPTNSNEFKQTAARPLKTGFIIDKATKDLGYNPHSFDEGVRMISQQLLRIVAA